MYTIQVVAKLSLEKVHARTKSLGQKNPFKLQYPVKKPHQSGLSSLFSCESSIVVELEVGGVGFCGGRKIGEPREKPSEQGKTGTNAHMAP